MNEKFAKRLEEYLQSECSDYGLKYTWKWDEDCNCCEVIISSENNDNKKYLNFKYIERTDDLEIELSEDSYYITREFDYSVKYFWMLISTTLFTNN